MDAPSPPILELREALFPGALAPCSLSFGAGTSNFLRGEPSSACATLLRVLGLLEPPMSGEVLLHERPTAGLDEAEREACRNRYCGFLFAAPFLLPGFTVVENVAMPLFKISQVDPAQAQARTAALLEFVGLTSHAGETIDSLSLPQRHAVSLARALGNEPAVLVVESLDLGFDEEDSAAFLALLRKACGRFGVALLAAAPRDFCPDLADRVIDFSAGMVRADSFVSPRPIA